MCVWLDQNNQNKKLIIDKNQNFLKTITNLTHRKDPTASGDRMRDGEKQQNHCSSVTRCRFLSRSWQRPILRDQTLNQKRRRWPLVCRWHTPTRSNPGSTLVCPLCDHVRIGPVLSSKTMNLAGSHSIEVLVPSKNNLYFHGYSSAEVLIDTPLRHSIWSKSLPKKQSAPSLVKKIHSHSQERPCASNEQKGPQDAQPRETLCIPNQSTKNPVTKETRSS